MNSINGMEFPQRGQIYDIPLQRGSEAHYKVIIISLQYEPVADPTPMVQ